MPEQVSDDYVERLLDECRSPYGLGVEAASIILAHAATLGHICTEGAAFRANMGSYVEECILDPQPHQIDLKVAILTVCNKSVTVRCLHYEKNYLGPSRLRVPASRRD